MRAAYRLAVILPALAGLGWLAVTATREGLDETQVRRATREMDAWASARVRPADGTVAALQGDLLKVGERNAAHPAVQELLGMLELRRPENPEYAQLAAVRFARSLELRPTSGYTWGNLLEAKYRIGESPAALESALLRAAALGPSEPEVQRIVADIGLATWNESSPRARSATEGMVAAGMKRNPLETLQIAGRRGRLDVACLHLVESSRRIEPKGSQLCPSREATP